MRKLWTDEERRLLTDLFPDNYTIDVCKVLKRGYKSVCSQADLMGLRKSEAFMKMELNKQGERIAQAGKAYQFKKGQASHNKGMKMPKETYEKVKHTMFKKGILPHNTKFDGHERLNKDGYIEVRIALGKYVLKHRHIWEQHNGKIPKGMVLVFKDRNKENLSIDNLELITMGENMTRNSIHRYPPELKSAIKLVSKLKRTINAKE